MDIMLRERDGYSLIAQGFFNTYMKFMDNRETIRQLFCISKGNGAGKNKRYQKENCKSLLFAMCLYIISG